MFTSPYFPPYIDASGLHLPTYEDRLQDLCSAYRSVFGQEAELSPAVPDYQLLSVLAKALDDTSALVLAAYNSRNLLYASGHSLDLLLPQYGISRLPGETDAEARNRLRHALLSRGAGTLDTMEAEIRSIPYVQHVLLRVNEEDTAADGIPPHTLAALVNNGSTQRIAEAIWRKKPPGIGTSGSLSKQVTDSAGNTHTVRFSRPQLLTVRVQVTVRTYEGYDQAAVETAARSTFMEYINKEMDIGEPLNVPQLYGMLYQAAGTLAPTFAVTDLSVSGAHGVEREKLVPAWNQKFQVNSAADVTVTTA